MRTNQFKALFSLALPVTMALSGPLMAKSRSQRTPASYEKDALDGVSSSNRIEGSRVHSSRRENKQPFLERWESDVNFCFGYTALKTSADSLSSFWSGMTQFHLGSGMTFDLTGMFGTLQDGKALYSVGAGLSWFSEKDFSGAFIAANGGLYLGPAVATSFPSAKLLFGYRFDDTPRLGTVGISGGPEALMTSGGVGLGAVLRVDVSLRI